jgi:hypothetical protein
MNPFHPAINIDKSIRRERLVYNNSFGLYFDYFGCYSLAGIVMYTCYILIQVTEIDDPFATILIFIVSIWLLCNLFFMNKLLKIQGGKEDENRQKVAEFFYAQYKNLEWAYGTCNVYVYKIEPKPIGITKIITLIFYNDEVYLNISTLNKRTDSKMLLSGLYDYLKAKKYVDILKVDLRPPIMSA